MEQSFLLASGIPEESLLDGLMEFANTYREHKFVEDIEVYRKKGSQEYLILFPNAPSLDHFAFAVNYLKYIPKNTVPTRVSGYFFNHAGSIEHSFQTGAFIKLYVSSNDKEYDNVNIVNSTNETYLYGFDGSRKKLDVTEELFEVPSLELDDFNHILNIIPGKVESENKPWWKFW